MLAALRPRPQWTRLVQAQRHPRRFRSVLPSEVDLLDEFHAKTAKRQTTGSLYVRVEGGIVSMQEAFAIVRGLERRLGRIRDFQIVRGQDDPTTYRPYFFAELENDTHWQEFPLEPVTLKLTVPKANPAKPGGVSLPDLREHLLPEDKQQTDMMSVSSRDETTEIDEESVVVEVRVERSDNVLFYPVVPEFNRMGRNATLNTGASFARWGGFYDPSRTDLEPPSMPTYGRMERAVASWNIALKAEAEKAQEGKAARTEEEAYADAVTAAEHHGSRVDAHETVNEAELEVPAAEPVPQPLFGFPTMPAAEQFDVLPSHSQTSYDTLSEPESALPIAPTPVQPLPPAKPTRKERILAQARASVRKSDAASPRLSAQESPVAEVEETDKKTADKTSLLWRLMGRKW